MTGSTTRSYNDGEVLSGVHRLRRWTPEEKFRIVEGTYLPGMSASLAGTASVAASLRLAPADEPGRADGSGGWREVVPASEYRALEAQVRELLREAVSRAAGETTAVALDLVAGGSSVSGVADVLGIARPHLSAMRDRRPPRPRGQPTLPDAGLVADIRLLVAAPSTYGYRRVPALMGRQAEQNGHAAPNAKRAYRVMRVHGLLLQRDGERHEARRHNKRVAVDQSNT